MNKRTSICIKNNQRIFNIEKDCEIIEPKQALKKLQLSKQKSFQKLLISDFTNSLDKIEFTEPKEQAKQKKEQKTYSLKEAVKSIHHKYLETNSGKEITQKQEVPDFIRQRDLQKREMMEIIQKNQGLIQSQKRQYNYQAFVVEIILIISIIVLWKQILENLKLI